MRRAASSRDGLTSSALIESDVSTTEDHGGLLALDAHVGVRTCDADHHRRERDEQNGERQMTPPARRCIDEIREQASGS